MNECLQIEKSAARKNRAETVLLVEDEAFVRNAASEILQSAGYRVLMASNGMAAQRLYDEFGPKIDLLLTDMILPGENGRELAARMRRRNPSLRILFVTGYAEQMIVLKDIGEEYLPKPFCSEALLRKVAGLMNGPTAHAGREDGFMRACVGA
jgi:two-component system, cell cycle sensor histidine kinase and response regulator CckA